MPVYVCVYVVPVTVSLMYSVIVWALASYVKLIAIGLVLLSVVRPVVSDAFELDVVKPVP